VEDGRRLRRGPAHIPCDRDDPPARRWCLGPQLQSGRRPGGDPRSSFDPAHFFGTDAIGIPDHDVRRHDRLNAEAVLCRLDPPPPGLRTSNHWCMGSVEG